MYPNLPYDDMNFTAFDILTAGEMNQLVANIESLADASGFNDGAIKSSKIDWATIGVKIGTISGATLNTSGSKDITGLGFSPRLVRFTVLWPEAANLGSGGFGAAASNGGQYAYAWGINAGDSFSVRNHRTDSCILAIGATTSTPLLRASYTQSLADGFRINVVTPRDVNVAYEALQ